MLDVVAISCHTPASLPQRAAVNSRAVAMIAKAPRASWLAAILGALSTIFRGLPAFRPPFSGHLLVAQVESFSADTPARRLAHEFKGQL
jgi:hypothetical protein